MMPRWMRPASTLTEVITIAAMLWMAYDAIRGQWFWVALIACLIGVNIYRISQTPAGARKEDEFTGVMGSNVSGRTMFNENDTLIICNRVAASYTGTSSECEICAHKVGAYQESIDKAQGDPTFHIVCKVCVNGVLRDGSTIRYGGRVTPGNLPWERKESDDAGSKD